MDKAAIANRLKGGMVSGMRLGEFFRTHRAEDESTLFEKEKRALLKELDETLLTLRCARANFERASAPEIVEACIYEIKSAQTRYNFLIAKAKRLGITRAYKI